MECLLRQVMSNTSFRAAVTASSTTYWMAGLSMTGSISLGVALVAGKNLVPSPAAGITALVTSAMSRTLANPRDGPGHCLSPARSACPARLRALLTPFGSRYGGDVQGVQQDKALLRTRLLKARSARSPDDRREAARRIRDALLVMPELQMAGTAAAYYSVAADPDTPALSPPLC